MITRKDDIHAVLTDPRFSRATAYPGAPRMVGEDITSVPGGIFNLDPPEHTVVRAIVNPFYTRRGIRRYRPMVRQHACALLDQMVSGPNPADLITGYTAPLPLHVNSDMLGVPLAHREQFLHDFAQQLTLTPTPDQVAEATAHIESFAAQVIAAHRREPKPDTPIGALVRANQHRDITDAQLQGTVSYLLVTGSEPLVAPLGTGTHTLLRHRTQLDELIEDPLLWPAAVEEILRYHHNGVLGMPRVATEDVTIAGTTIAAGDAVCTPMLGATMDPDHYIKPHQFNIHRGINADPTFGACPHFCLGANFARMFLVEAWSLLFSYFPSLELAINDTDIPWARDLIFIKPLALPVTWNGAGQRTGSGP
ncbi:cytochrome P450 [Kibdelosporangium aridum]|uniref:cytochrome P450 n=1 Tax=Kibdelosporangium aridum TaxID=2030 RepID=UPI0035E6AAA9